MRQFRTVGLAVSFCILSAVASAATIYVKSDAAGANTGVTWANAYTDLQSALAAANFGDKIWVAAGTYKPTSVNSRTAVFAMKAGVSIYGGFAGTETARDQRNSAAHETILSGEIGAGNSFEDNSIHVVKGANLAALDGFTITGGYADNPLSDSNGGGLINVSATPLIAHCVFESNRAVKSGGGISNVNCAPEIKDCTFTGNTARNGGGMSGGSATRCAFNGNSAMFGGGLDAASATDCVFDGNLSSQGGGMNGGDATDCTFTGNGAVDYCNGGGMCGGTAQGCAFIANSMVTGRGAGKKDGFASECTFTSNTISNGNGAGMADGNASHCSFFGNVARYGGGFCDGNALACSFVNNHSPHDGGGMFVETGPYYAKECTFTSNTAVERGGGFFNIGNSVLASDCIFRGNSAGISGGGMENKGFPQLPAGLNMPVAVRCVFEGNTAESGGGMHNYNAIKTQADSCVFVGNTATNGGGMSTENASPIVTNCVFAGNTATEGGGGMDNRSSGLTAANCSFRGNSADVGGGIATSDASVSTILINCILWGDHSNTGLEISGGAATFRNCDVQGCGGSGATWEIGIGSDGLGNQDADPKFLGAGTPGGDDGIWRTKDDGFRLAETSPCIDAGRDAGAPTTDILGFGRWGRIDLGAYETFYLNAAREWQAYR